MGYSVPDSEIIAETRIRNGQGYTVRRYAYPGRYEGELIFSATFDANSSFADMSVADSDGCLFADFFRAPFNLETLDSGPELSESEINYLNTFAGAKLHYNEDGGIYLRLFDREDDFDENYLLTLESAF